MNGNKFMEELNCEIKLKLGESPIDPEKIFDKVFTEIEKYEVLYEDGPIYNNTFKGDKLSSKSINIKNGEKLFENIKGGGIYFILNSDGSKILYIGKAQDLKARLKQHLQSCSVSTSSHIEDVINYLIECQKKSKKMRLQYCVINTVNDKHNAAIEGALIDYIIEKKASNDARFDECWNERKD